MSDASERIRALREQQETLAREIAALEEAERIRVESEPVTLEVFALEGERVMVRASKYRADIVNLQRTLPSRYWHDGPQANSFELRFWDECLKKMSGLQNVVITYVNGVREQIAGEVQKPDYSITASADSKFLLVKVGRADSLIISRTPGTQWDAKHMCFTVPIVEGWRLFEKLEKQDKVVWAEDALAIVRADMEKRARLDEIALRKESDLVVDLKGHELRPFQKVGVEFIEASSGRTLLADQMGLGKTWQFLAYCARNKLRALVVCPASLKANWAREIYRLTGERAVIHTGTIPTSWDMKSLVIDKKQFHIINYDILGKRIETYDETKTSEGKVLKINIKERWLWVDLVNASQFDAIGLDEAHYAKNIEALRSRAVRLLEAPRIVAMTGTPVLNRPGELWPVLTLLHPDKFPSYENFLYRYTFNGKDVRNVIELRELLKPIMIRRLKKDVMADLPPINRVIRWTELSEKAQKLTQRVLEGIYESLREWDPSSAGSEKLVPNMLVQIMRLKQIASVDRIDFVADTAVEVNDSLEERDGAKHDRTHKVIVFSQFVPIAHAISRRLGNEALCMTGEHNAQKRDEIVTRFQNDPEIRFLVATDRVAGEGHNLQVAHAVIFADLLWTPAAHEQCEGRAYGRLADAHTIDSYWCAAEDSIDEDIMTLLDKKMGIINQTVEGIDTDRSQSVVKELLMMLKARMEKGRAA